MLNPLTTIRMVSYLSTDALAPCGLVNRARQDEDTLLIFFSLKDSHTLSVVLI
jgi:hypothetical protein